VHATCTYQVEVRGLVDENDLNAMSPLQARVVRVHADEGHPDEEHPDAATLFTIQADQSALIGLMRHLHGRGFVLLSVYRER
jgi:hypothetical protein